jgi:hypothetical protein
MAGSRVLIPQVRRLATLLATAAIATALAGVAPAVAGGKPMPATPAQRSAAAANSQVANSSRLDGRSPCAHPEPCQ